MSKSDPYLLWFQYVTSIRTLKFDSTMYVITYISTATKFGKHLQNFLMPEVCALDKSLNLCLFYYLHMT